MDHPEIKPYVFDGVTPPSIDSSFWGAPAKWPREPLGFVFLARAVHIVGKAKFGEEWVGDEPATPVPPPFEHFLKNDEATIQRVVAILERFGGVKYDAIKDQRKEIASDVPAPSLGLRPIRTTKTKADFATEAWAAKVLGLTDEHYALLREVAEPRRQALLAKAQRVAQIRHIIERGCEAGSLRAATRPAPGGPMQPLDPVVWNTDQVHQRWHLCQINPKDPYGLGVSGNSYCPIFLEAGSLERFIAPPAPKEPPMKAPGFDDVHLSPYLRLMLEVARDLKITPENQPKKEEVAAVIQDRWAFKESDRLVKAMATLLREPESQGGRGKK